MHTEKFAAKKITFIKNEPSDFLEKNKPFFLPEPFNKIMKYFTLFRQ